ncbi:ABC transporter permease [Nocardia higoensis]|uniref:ABC transporter permease n=1 Tax=Nocardia higoensis TaxID=228599 RepID=UPI0002F3530B|nr:ABC transporter permease [Nocardia higoensis]
MTRYLAVLRYLGAKIAQALFVVWGAYTVTFVLLYALPYDAVDVLFGPGEAEMMSEADKARAREYYAISGDLLGQYLNRLGHAAQGDFGASTRTGEPVWPLVLSVLPQTAALAGLALLLALVLAFTIAFTAVWTRSERLANLIASLPAAGVSVPVFLVGLALLQVFSIQLGWFPPIGNGGFDTMILPAVTLAIPVSAPIAQLLVTNMDEGLRSGYVTVSIAKGSTRFRVLSREVLVNAGLPALTIAGVTFGNLLAGTVIVETVFSRSGLGRLTETAVRTQDVPLVQAVVVFAALVFVLVNLAVDLVYPLLDPRLRARFATNGEGVTKSGSGEEARAGDEGHAATSGAVPAGGAARTDAHLGSKGRVAEKVLAATKGEIGTTGRIGTTEEVTA